MRLMAGLAHYAAGMIGADHLREILRFGNVCFMAAGTDHARIRQLRHHGSWIFGMLGKWTVAGLTVDARMFARLLQIRHIAVAILTGLMTSIGQGFIGKFGQGVAAIVAILSKALWNEVRPDQQQYRSHQNKRYRQPDEVFGVFEFAHVHP